MTEHYRKSARRKPGYTFSGQGHGKSYRDSGVDIDKASRIVGRISELARRSRRPGVLGGIGGFGGFFKLDTASLGRPVLVAGADGVGTKLKIAFAMDKHDTVGIDLVAMNVNDVVSHGAEPLFFLDYIAMGKLDQRIVEEVVGGIVDGCMLAGCALLGGETAELPGFYGEGEYELAGFAVGIVDQERMITGSGVLPGHQLIGLCSNGLHSNGFSLARHVLLEKGNHRLGETLADTGVSLGEELLKPTRIYVKSILRLLESAEVSGIAHITGGGLIENVPRALSPGVRAIIRKGSWPIPPIFELIRREGAVAEDEMYRTFNMGIGMVIVCPPESVGEAVTRLSAAGETPVVIGEVVEARDGVKKVEFTVG